MAVYLLWAIAGFVLIIAELMTGTFYLLVIGIAALVAAGVAFLGGAFWLQAIIAAAVTLVGVYAVRRWWRTHPKDAKHSGDLDRGQPVVIESWVNQAAGMARVKYRGTTWDAKVDGVANISDTLYIQSHQNGVLHISAKQ
jgi:membrane protein implicated in regulation of membrane protease activity